MWLPVLDLSCLPERLLSISAETLAAGSDGRRYTWGFDTRCRIYNSLTKNENTNLKLNMAAVGFVKVNVMYSLRCLLGLWS